MLTADEDLTIQEPAHVQPKGLTRRSFLFGAAAMAVLAGLPACKNAPETVLQDTERALIVNRLTTSLNVPRKIGWNSWHSVKAEDLTDDQIIQHLESLDDSEDNGYTKTYRVIANEKHEGEKIIVVELTQVEKLEPKTHCFAGCTRDLTNHTFKWRIKTGEKENVTTFERENGSGIKFGWGKRVDGTEEIYTAETERDEFGVNLSQGRSLALNPRSQSAEVVEPTAQGPRTVKVDYGKAMQILERIAGVE